jgi:hypothetical protein
MKKKCISIILCYTNPSRKLATECFGDDNIDDGCGVCARVETAKQIHSIIRTLLSRFNVPHHKMSLCIYFNLCFICERKSKKKNLE